MLPRSVVCFFVTGLLGFAAAEANAASLEVVPTQIELPTKGGPAQLRLVNHGDRPVDVQIESFAWKQNGNETLDDSDDIALSPPFAHLNPLSSQIVRLLLLFAGDGKGSAISWSLHRRESGLDLDADNSGPRRAKFTNLELVSADGSKRPISSHGLVYVLAGVTRSWRFPGVGASEGFRLEGDDENGRRRFAIPLAVTD